jgi:hypothetical protein
LFIALDAALVGLFWRASLQQPLAHEWRSLSLLAPAASAGLIGRAIALVPLVAGAALKCASLADLFLVASYPLTVAAFLAIPINGRSSGNANLADLNCGRAGSTPLWVELPETEAPLLSIHDPKSSFLVAAQ